MKDAIFVLLATGLISWAHADSYIDGRSIDLFKCRVDGRDRYGTALNDTSVKCTPIPQFKDSDALLSLSPDGGFASYIDKSSVVQAGARLNLDLLTLVPDSSKAVFAGGQSAPAFDSKTHYVYDCAARTWTSNKVELIRNLRTAPETIKSFIDNTRPFRPVIKDSLNEIVIEHFCARGGDNANGAGGGTAFEDSQALRSLAKAVPLMNKMQAGAPVSDKEVQDAHLGALEPLILTQASFGREAGAISAGYQKEVSDLQVGQMLTASTLNSPSNRASVRSRLKLWTQFAGVYKSQMDAATTRLKLGFQAALHQMPSAYTEQAAEGFDRAATQVGDLVERHVGLVNEFSVEAVAILDLLDANVSSFVYDSGPPPNLIFSDMKLHASYRQHVDAVLDISRRESVNQAKFIQFQSENNELLKSVFKH